MTAHSPSEEDTVIDMTPAAHALATLLDDVGDLAAPTPCAQYSVGDLLDHLDQVARGFAALARGGDEAPAPGGSWADPARRAALGTALDDLALAWADPAAWEGMSDAGVELSNELWGRIAATEVVVHGWDLARATGQAFAVPDETLRPVLEHVAVFVPQAPVPALWGPVVPLGADAPLIDRVVAATGRRPGDELVGSE